MRRMVAQALAYLLFILKNFALLDGAELILSKIRTSPYLATAYPTFHSSCLTIFLYMLIVLSEDHDRFRRRLTLLGLSNALFLYPTPVLRVWIFVQGIP